MTTQDKLRQLLFEILMDHGMNTLHSAAGGKHVVNEWSYVDGIVKAFEQNGWRPNDG